MYHGRWRDEPIIVMLVFDLKLEDLDAFGRTLNWKSLLFLDFNLTITRSNLSLAVVMRNSPSTCKRWRPPSLSNWACNFSVDWMCTLHSVSNQKRINDSTYSSRIVLGVVSLPPVVPEFSSSVISPLATIASIASLGFWVFFNCKPLRSLAGAAFGVP